MGIREDKAEEFEATYRNSNESLNQSEHYSKIMKDMALQLGSYQSVSSYLVQNSPFVYHNYNNLLFGKHDNGQRRVPTGTCIPFSKKIFMTVNGKLLPCERIGQQFAVGSVTDKGVELDLQSIANMYNCYYSKLDNRCKSCHNSKSCIQCIFNLPDLETTCRCHGFMTENDYRAYENAQLAYIYNNPEEYRNIMERVVII